MLNFFTPVHFGSHAATRSQALLEWVDSYFFLGGRKAYVLTDEGLSRDVVLTDDSVPFLKSALKVVSYFTIVLPCVALCLKGALRFGHHFHVIDVQKMVEEEVDVPSAVIGSVRALSQSIKKRSGDDRIIWMGGSNKVFRLTEFPEWVFKSTQYGWDDSRFKNMVRAQEVCLAHQLNLLVIPHAKQYMIEGVGTFVVEKYLDGVNPHESAQRAFYRLEGLDEAVKQLALFIIKTGFCDMNWRNALVLDTAADFFGDRRIAVVDSEAMSCAEDGMYGGSGARGLVRSLRLEAHVDAVLDLAQRYDVLPRNGSTISSVKTQCMQEIERERELLSFYQEKGLLDHPKQLIEADDVVRALKTSGKGLTQTMRVPLECVVSGGEGGAPAWVERSEEEIVRQLVLHINQKISDASEEASIQGKRSVVLDMYKSPWNGYTALRYEGSTVSIVRTMLGWLVEARYLFEVSEGDRGYCIQA